MVHTITILLHAKQLSGKLNFLYLFLLEKNKRKSFHLKGSQGNITYYVMK